MQPRFKSVQGMSPSGPHTLVYKEWGSERNPDVLLCVHGLTRVSDDFDPLARAMCGKYRVVCPDIVGRGRSSWLNDPRHYTLPVYVNDMLGLIGHVKAKRLAWLGTSMGGLIGMAVAAMQPSPIDKLILNDIGPALHPAAMTRIGSYVGQQPEFDTLEAAEAYIRQISASFGPHSNEQWRALARNVLRQNPNGKWIRNHDPGIALAFANQTEAARDYMERVLWATYDAISCPTLVIRGAQSDLLSAATALEMTRRGPNAALVELDGIGHAPMFMHGAQIELVGQFLEAESGAC